MITLDEAVNCSDLDELSKLAHKHKFHFFWQKQLPESVQTFDHMPKGFFTQYYGDDLDLRCPMAWAFRSRIWPVFSFGQARSDERFRSYDPDGVSTALWEGLGIQDGLLLLSGRPGLDSFSVFALNYKVLDAQKESLPFIVLTHKLDDWLENSLELNYVKREFSSLSPKESETLKIQIDYPQLSIGEQAKRLGISELTLLSRHERIAKKFKVNRYVGAVLLAERTGFFS